MKLLLLAALRAKKHLSFAILSIVTLFGLTFANQLELVALGVITNKGSDFFDLFKSEGSKTVVSKKDIEEKWGGVDREGKGFITQRDAALAISKKKGGLNSILQKLSYKFNVESNLISLMWIIACIAVFKAFFLFMSRYVTQLLSIKLTSDLRIQYFEHIQSLPLSFYTEYNLGSLATRASGDAGQIASSLNSCITNYLQTPFTLLTTFGMCFYVSWQLSLVIFLGLPLVIVPMIVLTKRVKAVSRQMLKNQESFNSILIDFLSGIQTIKSFAREQFSLKKYAEQNDKLVVLEGKSAKYSLLTRPILHSITTFCLVFVVIIGLYTLKMSVSELVVFCGFLYLFYEPVKKFAEENANIQKGVVAAERMFEVLHIKPHIQDVDGAIELKGLHNKIEFKNVSFKYKDNWVLKDLSFTIRKGETVALVGPTGAGKSTIVQLLLRLFDIQEGEIKIDEISLKDYTQKSLRENVAFVPQKPFLFFDTVSENITFGKEYPFHEIEKAAKRAHAHEFIAELQGQYNAILPEAGKTLSGGQQQRMIIARAFLKNAPILILDEATSSLDAISEKYIKESMFGMQREVTQIIIAHRLSTIEHADKVIYLEKGEKIAEGSIEELLEKSIQFRKMWDTFHSDFSKS